jgi:hypothetical protein
LNIRKKPAESNKPEDNFRHTNERPEDKRGKAKRMKNGTK